MSFSRKFIVLSALALVVGMGSALGAVAAKRAIETNALIFFTNPNTFNGSVTSPEPDCIPKRDVTVKKVRPGEDRKLATTRSHGHNGFYATTVGGAINGGDEFYAAVARRKIDAGRCGSAHSGTTTITTR